MKSIQYIVILFASSIAVSACQKIIIVDLNSAHPQIVIEAKMTDKPGSDTIKITKTANYFGDINFPKVSGAIVLLSDNTGHTDTLPETAPGIYTSILPKSVPGITYTLSVASEGKTYTAASTVAEKTKIDSLTVEPLINPINNKKSMIVYCHFKDKAGVANFYNVKEYVNDTFFSSRTGSLINDQYTDGNPISFPFSHGVKKGNVVKVELQSLNKQAYDYLSSLSTTVNDGATSLSPANPITNFNNNALGYFSAYTVDSMSIVVK